MADRTRGWVSGSEFGVNIAIAAALVVGLIVSQWTVFATNSGALVLGWTAAWCLGAGAIGWYKRSWSWPVLCPVAMMALTLFWAVVFGRTSWASTFFTMLGAMFAVSAAIGAVIGTWFGKRPCPTT